MTNPARAIEIMTIIDYDPGSRGAMSYLDASRELAERGAAYFVKGQS